MLQAMVRDVRRALWIARTTRFPCPGCGRQIPRAELLVRDRRVCCPQCGAVIIAPHGEPTGRVAMPPPGLDPSRPTPGRLGFLPAAAWGTGVLYAFWMLPAIARSAAVQQLGWRPIGWESTALTAACLALTFLFALATFGVALLWTTNVPGVAATAATIATVVAPLALFHARVVMPWQIRASHQHTWPGELPLAAFRVCADTFSLGDSTLDADGRIAFEVENTSSRVLRSATFTVKAGRPSDWLEHNAEYRLTIRDVAPGARARVERRAHLGSILWRGGTSYGGPGAASAAILWDDVQYDRRTAATAARPAAATIWPIPDCRGATRPDVPWQVRTYTAPE